MHRSEAVEFADRSTEAICYYAYWASTELAAERGRYSSFAGSLWDRGILPQDSLEVVSGAARRLLKATASLDGRDRHQFVDGLGCAA